MGPIQYGNLIKLKSDGVTDWSFSRTVWDFSLYYVSSRMQGFPVYFSGYQSLFCMKTVGTKTRLEMHSVYIRCYKQCLLFTVCCARKNRPLII